MLNDTTMFKSRWWIKDVIKYYEHYTSVKMLLQLLLCKFNPKLLKTTPMNILKLESKEWSPKVVANYIIRSEAAIHYHVILFNNYVSFKVLETTGV